MVNGRCRDFLSLRSVSELKAAKGRVAGKTGGPFSIY
jgi:hypothetical protein